MVMIVILEIFGMRVIKTDGTVLDMTIEEYKELYGIPDMPKNNNLGIYPIWTDPPKWKDYKVTYNSTWN